MSTTPPPAAGASEQPTAERHGDQGTAATPAERAFAPRVGRRRRLRNDTLYFALRNPKVIGALIVVLVLFGLGMIAPLAFDYGPMDYVGEPIEAPSTEHWFGTTMFGQDVFTQFVAGLRSTYVVGALAASLSAVVGMSIGFVAGYRGGWLGASLMRIVDAFLAFPSIFLLLALAALLKPSPFVITVIIALTSWMEIARIVEAEVRSLRERDFVQAGRMLGLSSAHIMFRELLPNVVGPIVVAATLTVARAILLEAYVSFLGYGIQPPLPSWGNMLNGAQQYLASAPWLAIVPGIAITIAVTSFNFIGDGLRDALDVRSSEHS